MGGSPAKIVKKVIKPIVPVRKPAPVTPTAAEVSQSESTVVDGMDSASKKIKRKGRSATILTSSEGIDQSVTLGTKSLLGG